MNDRITTILKSYPDHPEVRTGLIDELAELVPYWPDDQIQASVDPDEVEGESIVSEWTDARNSRPEPI